MEKYFFVIVFVFIVMYCYGQPQRDLTALRSVPDVSDRKKADYSQSYFVVTGNGSSPYWPLKSGIIIDVRENDTPKNYQRKSKLFISLTIPLVVASLVANRNNNRDLAGGFAVGGLVTSSLGLYYGIKDGNRRKKN
jgi:hypothetical protein